MGSVVLEQLLRFAPDVARIYMLIRGKRGNTGALWLSSPFTSMQHPPCSLAKPFSTIQSSTSVRVADRVPCVQGSSD